MIEIGLGSVQTTECDVMRHMNVQHYVARAVDSLPALAIAWGFGPRQARALDVELAATDHHIRFLKELRPGAPFVILGGVLGVEGDRLRLYQEMRNTFSGEVAATIITEAALVDAETRGRLPLPAELATRAAAAIVALPEHGAPKGLDRAPPRKRPDWAEADRLGLALTQQGAVAAHECDGRKLLSTRAVMARVSDAIPNVIARMSGRDRSAVGFGGAALEYRIVYHATPRLGDVLALRSGVGAIGAKTFRWGHWLFDRETGEAVATSAAIVVSFDLATRKAIPVGEETRRGLEKWLVPELSA
jgi:acyl-CoA thioester hydrolase